MAPAAEQAPKKSNARMVIVGVVLAFAAAGAGAWVMATRQPSEAATALPPPADYVALAPQFVVNLEETPSGPRYLQVEVQLVTRAPEASALLKHHAPALRARLLMLFAQQTYEGLATREGKEALQAEALEEVRALMSAETGQPQVDALLFTSFVTQ